MTARYVSELSRNANDRPTVAMTTPASAGPSIRLALKTALLSPTAFARFEKPTISVTNDWRAGLSTAVTHPSRNVNAYTRGNVAHPAAVAANRANAREAIADCDAISRSLLSK